VLLRIQVKWKDPRNGKDWRDTDDEGADTERAVQTAKEYQQIPEVKDVRVIDERENVFWP
jgi:hypothetical protein